MADLDGNTWYWITESRVNYTSALFSINNGLVFAANKTTDSSQYWQVFKLANGNVQFRNKVSNIKKQLGVCYVSSEASDSRTEPCMQDPDGSEGQMWSMSKWDDGTYKINNVANGTDFNLDWHPGGPGFLSPTTAEAPKQPAQHWMFSSLAIVEDGIYSTTLQPAQTSNSASASATGISGATSTSGSSASPASAATATASATSDSSSAGNVQKSSHSGLSSGAAAGIGVGIAVLVIALAALAFFLIRKQRRTPKNKATELPTESAFAGAAQPREKYGKTASGPVFEAPSNPPHYEMYSAPAELPATDTRSAIKTPVGG